MIVASVMLFPRPFVSEWLSQRTLDDLLISTSLLCWCDSLSYFWLNTKKERCVGSLKTLPCPNVDSDANSSIVYYSVKPIPPAMYACYELCAQVRIIYQFHAYLQSQIALPHWSTMLWVCMKFKVVIMFNHRVGKPDTKWHGVRRERNVKH